MKLSVFVSFMLIVAGVFFIFALMVQESNDQFSDADINSSEWEDSYDYVSDLNSTVYPLEQKLRVIQDTESGWFTKLVSGITAVPYAVITFPQVIFGSLEVGGRVTTGFLAALAIPGYIISIVILMILMWALFKLVEFFQRSPV